MRILLLACLAFSSLTFGASQQQEVPQTRLELLKEQAVVLHSRTTILSVMWTAATVAAMKAASTFNAASLPASLPASLAAYNTDTTTDAVTATAWAAAQNAAQNAAWATAWATAWDAARYAARQGRTPQEMGAAAWSAAENAAWNYIQANLYAGDRIWDQVTTATREALAPFGEEQFPNLVFVFSDAALLDPRFKYFEPFMEKILEVSDRLLDGNLGSPEARRGEYELEPRVIF